MKSLLVLGLVLCGSLVLANDRIISFVERAKSTSFGATLMGTIELELNSGAPGDYLVNLLSKMQKTLWDDWTNSNGTHNAFQANCKSEIEGFKNELSAHSKNVLESRKLISSANQKLAWDKVELENSQRQLGDAQVNREKLIKNREEEAKEYDQKVNEINEALETLHQGLNLVRNNLGGSPKFVQVANGFREHVRRMTSLIQERQYKGRGYVSLIDFVAELIEAAPVQASAGAVQRVLDLIQGIIDELERAKNIEYQAEQERIRNYEQLLGIYDRSIVELGRKIDHLTNEINQLNQIINFNKNRITDNTRQIQIKKRQQIKLKKECQAEQRSWEKDNSKRSADYDLVHEALAIIQENIETFRKIVLDNAKAGIAGAYGN